MVSPSVGDVDCVARYKDLAQFPAKDRLKSSPLIGGVPYRMPDISKISLIFNQTEP